MSTAQKRAKMLPNEPSKMAYKLSVKYILTAPAGLPLKKDVQVYKLLIKWVWVAKKQLGVLAIIAFL